MRPELCREGGLPEAAVSGLPEAAVSGLPEATVSALHVEGLRFAYGQNTVLHKVSLSVQQGEVCGLLGPNGSGKTTLFKCCMGFLPMQEGSVRLMGQDTAGLSPAKLAKIVAYVPQEHRQPFPHKVLDMVLMGRSPHMRSFFRLNAEDKCKAEAALKRVGLLYLADQPCNRLSGGQRQLVLIARALAQETPLLLLDEPTSALDFSNQVAVWSMIRHIAKDGKTVVVCCHDPNHILWFCDRVVVLKEGQVLTNGLPGEVLTPPTLHSIYGPCCTQVVLPVQGKNRSMVCPA